MSGVQVIPLVTGRNDGRNVEGFGTDLDGCFRVGHQIMVPIRVGRCASFGGEYDQTVAIGQVHQRRCVTLAAPGAGRCEEEQGRALEWAADFALVRAEFFDDLVVPVTHVCDCPFYC